MKKRATLHEFTVKPPMGLLAEWTIAAGVNVPITDLEHALVTVRLPGSRAVRRLDGLGFFHEKTDKTIEISTTGTANDITKNVGVAPSRMVVFVHERPPKSGKIQGKSQKRLGIS
jgi:hypothetical protein